MFSEEKPISKVAYSAVHLYNILRMTKLVRDGEQIRGCQGTRYAYL